MRPHLLMVLLVAALAAPTAGLAAEPFSTLFAQTCMKQFYTPDKLRADMTARHAPVVDAKPAAFFLGGRSGTAWGVKVGEGRYVVALRDDGVCAVFAWRASVADVQRDFAALVSTAPKPLTATRMPDSAAGPNTGLLKSVAYAWSRPGDTSQLVFALTTSSEAHPEVQAMASMGLVKKEQ